MYCVVQYLNHNTNQVDRDSANSGHVLHGRRAAKEEGERRAKILIRLGNPSAEELVQPRYENLQKEDGKENLDPHHLRHCFE